MRREPKIFTIMKLCGNDDDDDGDVERNGRKGREGGGEQSKGDPGEHDHETKRGWRF